MPLEWVEFEGRKYPKHESIGNAAQWIMPMALYYCKGNGLDVGYSKEKWKMPGAIGVEPSIDAHYHATNLPYEKDGYDYLFSSHCLEHVKENWMNVLDYWLENIKSGGILFLYLPHKTQFYWLPQNNRKHVHSFEGIEIKYYLMEGGHNVFVGGCDANHSFVVICEKK